jgi:hypothetical protein
MVMHQFKGLMFYLRGILEREKVWKKRVYIHCIQLHINATIGKLQWHHISSRQQCMGFVLTQVFSLQWRWELDL